MLGHLKGDGCLSLGKPNLNRAGNGYSLCSANDCSVDQVSVYSGESMDM